MGWAARAPGKLVVLGEYAVLDGAPALVMAVTRWCHAAIRPSSDADCHLRVQLAESARYSFASDASAPSALVALVSDAPSGASLPPWDGRLDSSEFFVGATKLGLGSSAAALVAWAGCWSGYAGKDRPALEALIDLHRRFQGGKGSGLDVAAAYTGGVIDFRLDAAGLARVGSVKWPNSVRFAGIFAGASASTPDLVARYRAWAEERPGEAAKRLQSMGGIAAAALTAVAANEGETFLQAVAEYGQCLDELGQAMRVDLVTASHREILAAAKRFGVVYKVSGAGGGDLGLALSNEPARLEAFEAAVRASGYRVLDFEPAPHGLIIEETAQ